MSLSIARIYYPVKTLGPGNRIGIWTAGCPRCCDGCISPALQSAKNGRALSTDEMLQMISSISQPIDGITISGGEPFENAEGLAALMEALSARFDDIILFTGYTYEELIAMQNDAIQRVLSICAVLIDGPYQKELHQETGLRGSSNQNIYVFKNHAKHQNLEHISRQLQPILYGNNILTIGIP